MCKFIQIQDKNLDDLCLKNIRTASAGIKKGVADEVNI